MQFCSIYWTYISFLAVTEFDSQTSEKGASWKTSQPLQFLRILCVMRRNDILFSISTYYYGNTWNVFTQWRSSFKSTSNQNNTMNIRSEASKHAFLPSTTEGSVDCVQDNACTKAEWFEAFAKGVICKNDHSWIESKFHFLNNNRRPKVQSQTYKEFLPVNITRLAQLEKPDRCCGSQMVVAKSNWTAKEFTCFVRRNREQNNLLQIKEQIQFSAFTFWKIGDGVWHCVWTALYR